MNTAAASADLREKRVGPWHPGVESQVPWDLVPLCTHFRPDNVFTNVAEAKVLRDFTGLDLDEVVAFRPERLALHELLIRITADFSVPDGPRVEDLGIHFRHMASTVLATGIAPHMGEIRAAYDGLRGRLKALIEAELAEALAEPRRAPPGAAAAKEPGLLRGWLRALRGRMGGAPVDRGMRVEVRSSASRGGPGPVQGGEAGSDDRREPWRHWTAKAQSSEDGLQRAAYSALARVVGALFNRHGRLWGEHAMIAALAADMACNDYGSELIGQLVEPYLLEAARRQGYRPLPTQERPIVLNTKGASASGKSTLRPQQKKLAERIGASWSDFAVISPDIWRKQLLDYASLGAAFRYAGAFTSHELKIIDQKLDRYMARKAEQRGSSHLLIDRFRFDSFAPDRDEAGKHLLTRFGDIVYLFFMITPPQATVERSWKRGLEVGRYKAVDDLLAHNVEAYSGMPRLFFTWALRADRRVHYEFLDNSVALGEPPRTVAFGWNGEMNVLDVGRIEDVERFRKIDIGATTAAGLYADPEAVAPERNTHFLAQCAARLAVLNFAAQQNGRIYLHLKGGAVEWADPEALQGALADPDTRAGLLAVVPDLLERRLPRVERPTYLSQVLDAGRIQTVGSWGESGPSPVGEHAGPADPRGPTGAGAAP